MGEVNFTESGFLGLDAGRDASALPPGFVSVADNVAFDVSGSQPALRTRPGFRGMLTAALGQPLREAIAVARTDSGHAGEKWALLVAGDSSTAKIYRWQKDTATAPASITPGGVNFDARITQFVAFGEWIFISGAVDGRLYRYRFPDANIEACYPGAAALIQPVLKVAAKAGNVNLDPLDAQYGWAEDVVSSSLTIPDKDFAGSVEDTPVSSGSDLSPDWKVDGGTVETDKGAGIDSANPTLLFARLDGASDAVILKNPEANDTISNANGVGTPRFATTFEFEARFRKTATGQSINATVALLDAADTPLVEQTLNIAGTGTADAEDVALIFTFAGEVDPEQAEKVLLRLSAGEGNGGGSAGPYISNIVLRGAKDRVGRFTTGGVTTFYARKDVAPFSASTLYLGGTRLAYELAQTTDFDRTERVLLAYRPTIDIALSGIRLGLRTGTSDAAALSASAVVVVSNNQRFLQFDLSDLTAADRQNITHVDLLFENHLTMDPPFAGPTDRPTLFAIGALTAAGALTPERGYSYLYREANSDAVVSPALAAPSGAFEATEQKAVGIGTIEAGGTFPANTGADIEVFRTDINGRYRLAFTFTPGADSAPSLLEGLTGDGFFWDDSARTFYDSIVDAQLLLSSRLMDHDAPPFDSDEPALAVGVKGPRLVVATREAVYASQITIEEAAGLYWTMVVDPDAPSLPLQGWNKRLANASGVALDSSLGQAPRFIEFRTWTVGIYPGSIYVLRGEEVPQFVFGRFAGDEGRGTVSHRSVRVLDGEIYWLAGDGYRAWGGTGVDESAPGVGTVRRASTRFSGLLNPQGAFDGAALSPSVYGASASWTASERLYLATAKDSASSAPEVVYMADGNIRIEGGAWARWLKEVNGGFAWEGDDAFYAFDSAGMIYRVGHEYGDRAAAAGDVTAVRMRVRTRRFRVPGREKVRGLTLGLTVEIGEATTLEIETVGDAIPKNRHQRTFDLSTTGVRRVGPLRIAGRCEGDSVYTEVAAETVQPVTIRLVQMKAATFKGLI